jgi:L-fuconolactonase
MIIDTHTHFYDPARPQGVPWPRPADTWIYRTVLPADYRALAEPLGITGTVVVEASPWVEDNQWLLDTVRDEPFVLGIIGNLDPRSADFAANLERFARNPLFRGIRCGGATVTGADSGAAQRQLAGLARRGLTLDLQAGMPHLAAVADLARALPALRIVVNHLGLVAIDGGRPDAGWTQAIQALAELPSVFMKVSAYQELSRTQPAPVALSHYEPVFDAVWQAFGPDRLVFGSDWPVSARAGTLAASLDLWREYAARHGAAAVQAVLGETACRAYGVARPRLESTPAAPR